MRDLIPCKYSVIERPHSHRKIQYIQIHSMKLTHYRRLRLTNAKAIAGQPEEQDCA